jgi:hypothetical protein
MQWWKVAGVAMTLVLLLFSMAGMWMTATLWQMGTWIDRLMSVGIWVLIVWMWVAIFRAALEKKR